MIYRKSHSVRTAGRGSYDLTERLQSVVRESGVSSGLCNVFVHHTSASLMLCENADPDVRVDLERFLSDLAPDGDPRFVHVAEGPDDMPAHVRSVLTHGFVDIPVEQRRCDLGTWQGLYLYEHRHAPHTRRVTFTVYA
ncbi:MAG: secondary thiamine-phosphate synthase enzyme YjbQ [Gammaproteobacteria bacterium]|nr:secondary thiamine-phosphate synthase enzyme YjbQ [Gammaproteobacteria bacterium]